GLHHRQRRQDPVRLRPRQPDRAIIGGMGSRDSIRVVLLGMGTVGGGVARALTERSDTYARRVGVPIELLKVLVLNKDKPRDLKLSPGVLTNSPDEALSTDCDIV